MDPTSPSKDATPIQQPPKPSDFPELPAPTATNTTATKTNDASAPKPLELPNKPKPKPQTESIDTATTAASTTAVEPERPGIQKQESFGLYSPSGAGKKREVV